jgi:hypothetical protein
MQETFYLWLIESIGGLILIGFGLSLFGQAVIYKSRGAKLTTWFLWGTLSLIVVNAGICVFGDAVANRLRYENERALINRRDNER